MERAQRQELEVEKFLRERERKLGVSGMEKALRERERKLGLSRREKALRNLRGQTLPYLRQPNDGLRNPVVPDLKGGEGWPGRRPKPFPVPLTSSRAIAAAKGARVVAAKGPSKGRSSRTAGDRKPPTPRGGLANYLLAKTGRR